MITDIGHVAIRVTDLDAAVEHATQVLGLREVSRSGGVSYLTHGARLPSHRAPHHCVQYIQGPAVALDHIGLEVSGEEGLAALRDRLAADNVSLVSTEPEEEGIGAAIRFVGPDGHVFEAFANMEEVSPGGGSGAHIRSFGHVAIKTGETVRPDVEFLVDVLDFSVSDYIGANPPQGVSAVPRLRRCTSRPPRLRSLLGPPVCITTRSRSAPSRWRRSRHTRVPLANAVIWGPGRPWRQRQPCRLPLRDPSGTIVEHYCDMQIVVEPWQPREWNLEDYRGRRTSGPRVLARPASNKAFR